MGKLLQYTENNRILMVLLFVLIIAVIVLWNFYLKEKRRADKIEGTVLGERKFYKAFARDNREFYLCIQKSDLKILYISPNFEQMTGLSARSLYVDLERIQEIMDQTQIRKIKRDFAVWDQKSALEYEIEYHKVGNPAYEYAMLTIEPLKEQQVYLIAFRNITEAYAARQKMQKELETAQKESKSKTDFLSQMSHEIRTPMNGIIGMLNLTRVHINEREAVETYLSKIEELSQFLLNLINDILDMSRIESGKMKLEQVPFDLFKMAEKLDAMFRSTVEDKGIHWDIQMQDFDVRYVIGDEMRLSQVMINFISNASKFTSAGGTITVIFRQMDKLNGALHLMMKVRDTGKGIKEDFISKIFRPFEQEDASTARNYGGSGLGMAIAEDMDNTIEDTVIMSPEEQTEDFSMKGLHILLAEDNDINAEIAMEILTMEGAVVTRACDGNEVVRLFRESSQGEFDVILMDIQMPGMDGWEATKVIRKMKREDADILIFAMSANAFVEDRRHSKAVGMNGHISKPVDYDQVRQIIGKHMCARRSH